MMNLAERWGLRPDASNPCRHVERYRERRRERFLSPAELARLGDALAEMESEGSETPSVVAAIRLLVFTGARRGEIVGLRWEWVDPERRCLRLPDSKTGAKTIPLSAPALQVLAALPAPLRMGAPDRRRRGSGESLEALGPSAPTRRPRGRPAPRPPAHLRVDPRELGNLAHRDRPRPRPHGAGDYGPLRAPVRRSRAGGRGDCRRADSGGDARWKRAPTWCLFTRGGGNRTRRRGGIRSRKSGGYKSTIGRGRGADELEPAGSYEVTCGLAGTPSPR